MKKKHILITALIFLVAVFCSACSSGTPLAKAAAKLQKSAESGYYEITYVEADDKLVIAITDRTDLDALFETLNKYIDGKDVGTLIFDTRVGDDINNGTARSYCDKIAALPCSSIKVLGVGPVLSEYIRWAPAVQKADLVYMVALLDPDLAKDNQMLTDTENAALLTSVERLWISDVHLSNLKYYPNLTEIGIDAFLIPQRSPWAVDVEAGEGESSEDEAASEPTARTFSGGSVYKYLTPETGVKRLLIAPTSPSYDLSETGSQYMLTLQFQYPDLLINAPETPIEIDPAAPIDDAQLVAVKDVPLPRLSEQGRASVIKNFLNDEAEDCYNKATKLTLTSDSPVVHGKALICLVDPGKLSSETWYENTYWPTKRQWSYEALPTIVMSGDIDGHIPTPDGPGDYETFIYVYPIYVLYGSYNAGTEAYTMTYKCQVFDFRNGVAYEAKTVASADPPQTIYYSGSPQLKASGKVESKDLYAYLKTLKVEE